MTLGSLPGHGAEGTTTSSFSFCSSFSSQSRQTLCFPRTIIFHGKQVKLSIILPRVHIFFAFWIFKWQFQMYSNVVISKEKRQWMWSVHSVPWNVFIYIKVWDITRQTSSRWWWFTHPHTDTYTHCIYSPESVITASHYGRKNTISRSILRASRLVGKHYPSPSETHCWEHKPQAAIGHQQARGLLHLCS